MKKRYEKPVVLIESFELSKHIAACNQPVKNKTSMIKQCCSADIPSLGIHNIFYKALGNTCKVDGESMYCYTKGGQSNYIFSS
jgi:hypothetical protein